MRLRGISLVLGLLTALGAAQTTTTVTGTIKDLTGAVVTSGQVTFDLKPGADTTISGSGRFVPTTITCLINGSGQLTNAAGSGSCVVTQNTALTPSGTYYLVTIWPAYVAASKFNWYAVGSSQDITTVVPTPATQPAYTFVASTDGSATNLSLAGITGGNGVFQPTLTTSALAWASPAHSFSVTDTSPTSTDATPALDNHVAPFLRSLVNANGGADVPNFYGWTQCGSGGTAPGCEGILSMVTANRGWRGGAIFQNIGTADDSAFAIATISQSAGAYTIVTTTAPNVVVGDLLNISGVTDPNFDTGAAPGCAVTAVSGSTITCTPNGGTTDSPSSGGTVDPVSAQTWGMELDMFESSRDPLAPTPQAAVDNPLVHGWTGTSNGAYSPTDDFFADSSAQANAAYAGFFCQDAKRACFLAGQTPNTGGTTLQSPWSFLAAPSNTATASAQYASAPVGLGESIWPGGRAKYNWWYWLIPSPGTDTTTTSKSCLGVRMNAFEYNDGADSGCLFIFSDGGGAPQIAAPHDNGVAAPFYSFSTSPTSGLTTVGGVVTLAQNGGAVANTDGGYQNLVAVNRLGLGTSDDTYVCRASSGVVNVDTSPNTCNASGTVSAAHYLENGTALAQGSGSISTTSATSDAVPISWTDGATRTPGHCSLGATNSSAAANIASTFISAKTPNAITLTHSGTAGMTYDLVCTAN